MTALFTRDEMREVLRRQNVGEAAIEAALNREFGEVPTAAANFLQVVGEPLSFPVRLTLPWSALCSDNEREKASLTMRGGKPFPRKVLGARYKAAREKTQKIGREVMRGFPPLAMPLALNARVYVPGGRRGDVCNFAKGVHDALSKIVYEDDHWLDDTRWIRVGVDTDAPRADITVTPL